MDVWPLANVPLGPEFGAEKTTGANAAGLFAASSSFTESEFAKVAPTRAVWGVEPGTGVIETAGPWFVKERLTLMFPQVTFTEYGPPTMLLA